MQSFAELTSAQLQVSASSFCTSAQPVDTWHNCATGHCFKEIVASPTRSSDCTKFEKRLAEAELSIKKHKERLQGLDGRAEALERENRQFNLVVYNVPDTAEEEDHGDETLTPGKVYAR